MNRASTGNASIVRAACYTGSAYIVLHVLIFLIAYCFLEYIRKKCEYHDSMCRRAYMACFTSKSTYIDYSAGRDIRYALMAVRTYLRPSATEDEHQPCSSSYGRREVSYGVFFEDDAIQMMVVRERESSHLYYVCQLHTFYINMTQLSKGTLILQSLRSSWKC